MTHPSAKARFVPAWLLAGTLAAGLSLVVLAMAALSTGQPGWLPLNATTHALYGAEAATRPDLDFRHTGLGLVIHIVSAFFWAGVAASIARITDAPGTGPVWGIGLGAAVLAGLVDYGLMPPRLTPGWELVLPPAGLVAGFTALGVGIACGLVIARQASAPRLPPGPSPLSRVSPLPLNPGEEADDVPPAPPQSQKDP